MEPLLYRRKLAASALSLSLRAIDYLIRDGKLKTIHVGAKNMVPRAELIRFAKHGLATRIAGDSK